MDQVDKLKREIRTMQEAAERRNAELDALGMVWCDGGCSGGMHRFTDQEVTADQVAFLLHNAHRAAAWFINRQGKGHDDYIERFGLARDDVLTALAARYEDEIAQLKAELELSTAIAGSARPSRKS